MKKMMQALIAALALGAALPAFAAPEADLAPREEAATKPVPEPVMFTSTHTGTFGGQKMTYRVEAGETHIPGKDGEAAASLFTISYIRENARGPRPVSFVFNGGPGSASVWLHLGLLGPKRVQVASDADSDDGAAPYVMLDNPLSLLDVTDLVFIDPVGTGYSRAVGKGEDKDYWSEEGDGSSIAEFIRIWITKNQRWNAP
jgi:carboxypeptidase C (cathepsin A)